MKTLEVLFTPADFAGLKQRNFTDAVCVVLDVFRATSTMITALANGAEAIIPVGEISEAIALRQRDPDLVLAGERGGVRIQAALTGNIDFDLGNSPREFTRTKIGGKIIVMTTTNGTRALRSCSGAKAVFVGSFLNLQATATRLRKEDAMRLLIVGSGTFEQAAYEDALAAGALCELLAADGDSRELSDSALMARQLFQTAQGDLLAAASRSRNGRRLLSKPELRGDVAFCMQRDQFDLVAALQPGGQVRMLERRGGPLNVNSE